ncbi:MAG: DMT family transporter [Chitinophagaceae bacterium]
MTIKQKAYLALTATSIIWGTTWVASKMAVQHVPGLQVSAIRQLIAGLIYITFFKFQGQPWPTFQQFKRLLLLSFFMLIIANGFSSWSIGFISSGLAALIATLSPLSVVVIEMVFYKAKYNWLTFIGLLVGLSGVVVVFYENAFHHQSEGYILGITLGIIAMISWSIGNILVAKASDTMNPYYSMGWQMFISAPFIFLFAVSTKNTVPISSIPFESWASIAYLVILGSCFTFVCFIYTLKNLPPALSSLYAYINPIVAMFTGALLLQEELSTSIILGSLITISGVFIVNKSLKK